MARREGFSLIELLIVVVVFGIAIGFMLDSTTRGNRTYTVLDQVAETQQNMRAVADLMERDIRHAGMMVPPGAALCGVDSKAGPDTLYVSDAEAIDPGDDILSYQGAEITSGTGIAGLSSGEIAIGLSSLALESSPPRPAYDLDGDGSADSDFRPGAGVIVIDFNDPSRGTVCGSIDSVNVGGSSIVVNPVAGPLGTAGGPVKLVAVPAHEYRIDGDELYRDDLLLAKGVEDLQLAYYLDLVTENNEIDAGEMRGTVANTNDYEAEATDISKLREVTLNLVVRTRRQDDDFPGRPQATGNRGAGADDGFRRRVYTATIMVRNMFERIGV